MTVEQLLKPRYKVIADYPFSPYKIGDLMKQNGSTSFFITTHKDYVDGTAIDVEDNVFEPTLKKYPHLFRKLHWWEERKPAEMPEYFKIPPEYLNDGELISEEKIYSVKESGKWGWNENDAYVFNYKSGGGTLSSYLLPATETEYNEYLKTPNP